MPSEVRDIHDILEITVLDEDKDHKYEFLGKVRLVAWLGLIRFLRLWFHY